MILLARHLSGNTLISLLLTITLFIYPSMLLKGYAAYDIMLQVMPNYLWGVTFFIAATLKGIGLLCDIKIMRKLGLVMSAVIYFVISLSFSVDFPALSSITYGVLSVFSVVSIHQVKNTSIINKRGGKKNE